MTIDELNEKTQKTGKTFLTIITIFLSLLLISGLYMFITGFITKDSGVVVDATINHINVHRYRSNGKNKVRYSVYVDYTYNGEKYTNIKYPTYKSGMAEGNTIQGKINPDKPTEFYSSTEKMINGGATIAISLFLLIFFHRSKNKKIIKNEE